MSTRRSRVANASEYGLSGAVYAETQDEALAVATRLRTGQVSVNGGRMSVLAPFRASGTPATAARLGHYGLDEYVERVALNLPA